MRPRLGLAASAGIVAFCGLGLAALKHPSRLTVGAIYTASAAVLVVAVILAILQPEGRGRAFWVGFAATGWAHHLLAFWPTGETTPVPRLLTTVLLDCLSIAVAPGAEGIPAYLGTLAAHTPGDVAFYQVGLPLMGLLLATVGGVLTAMLAALGGGLIARRSHDAE